MQKYLYFNRLPNIQASFKQLAGNSASSQKKLTTARYRTRQVTRCITKQTYRFPIYRVRGSSAS